MTIQTLFDRMMLYDNSLSLISGGDDVTRGLTAINLVQDWFEVRAARRDKVCQTDDTFTSTANTERTNWPTGLLRLDEMYRLDADSVQVEQIKVIQQAGGHRPGLSWPFRMLQGGSGTGAPRRAYANGQGGAFFWQPKPDAVYTFRAYGLWAVGDYAAAGNTFGRPDSVALVVAPFAVKVLRTGLDRPLQGVHEAAEKAFDDVLDAMGDQVKSEPESYYYSEIHTE